MEKKEPDKHHLISYRLTPMQFKKLCRRGAKLGYPKAAGITKKVMLDFIMDVQ